MVVSVGITLLGIDAIALICRYAVPPIPHGPAFDAQFTVLDDFFYADQPAKTVAYQLSCVATPLLLLLSFWAARRWAARLSDQAIDRVNLTGLILYLLLMVSCAWPIIYCPNPPFWIIPPAWIVIPFDYSHPFYSPFRLLILAGAIAIEYYLLTHAPSRRNSNRVLILLLGVWALMIPSRFYLPCEISDNPHYQYHLNAVLDALSQVVNGHHLLVDFPHIYGGYIEMLAPFIRLFPRDPGVLIAALALPNIIALLCQLLMVRLLIRQPAVQFVCGFALLGANYLGSIDDINYSFITVRFFFPSIGLLAALLYFHRTNVLRYATATLIAAIASIWNLDTGIVLWLSWLATLLAMDLAKRNFAGLTRHLLIQGASLVATWTVFLLYLWLVSGQRPDTSLLFYFQTFVINSGYFCLRLLFPDMWVFIITLYLIGLALAVVAFIRSKATTMTPAILLISLFGIGSFSYFMGRSAPTNLAAVAYPAVLLAGIFCAKGELLMRRRKLPSLTRFFLLPSKIALFWWAFLMIAALPDFFHRSAHVLHNWNNAEQTPFRQNAAFVIGYVQPHEEKVFFLSNHSGFYSYLSDTTRPLKIPGMIELLRARDMDVLINAIETHQIGKLFVEQNFYDIQMYRPEIYAQIQDAIRQNYQVAETGPTGRLILYTPR
jgi:hypothetical protein